jgi:hypothetical protein
VKGGSGGNLTKSKNYITSSSKGVAYESKRANNSSLHRAVMEKLEVRRAMNDLVGNGEG